MFRGAPLSVLPIPRWARLGRWLLTLGVLLALPAAAQDALPPDAPAARRPEEKPEAPPPGKPPGPGEKDSGEKDSGEKDSLEELLQEEVSSASVGSFGYRLRRYGITPYVHGVITADLWQWERRHGNVPHHNTFELRDANLYFGADILDLVVPEVFLEFEPTITSFEFNTGIRLRYAQLDLRLHKELLILRAGLFLIPFGTYNTTTFPAFITKLPERPTLFREIIPSPWQEVGVQLLGSWEWAPGRALSYALFATNGMEQYDFDDPFNPDDNATDEGGSIAFFAPSYMDTRNTSKSFGARLSAQLSEGLTLGASGYTGTYTRDGGRGLSIFGLDANFLRGPLSLELEAAYARQEITGGTLEKWGYSAIGAYRLHAQAEAVLAVDEAEVGTLPPPLDRQSFSVSGRSYWGGLIFFPFPTQIPTALTKAIYRVTAPDNGQPAQHVLIFQLAVGF
jgi:hypothetical protein